MIVDGECSWGRDSLQVVIIVWGAMATRRIVVEIELPEGVRLEELLRGVSTE